MNWFISRAHSWYAKNERFIASLALLGGFVFNALALKRVDLFWENFWIIEHLSVVALCIFFVNFLENKGKATTKIHFWLIAIMQFTFGGLLSTFLVFYFRSTALAVTWPFLVLLAGAFIANERLKRHRSRLVFQIILFYLSLFSFSIYIIPVILHTTGRGVFILSGFLGLVAIILFLWVLQRFAYERFIENRHLVARAVLGIFLAVNVLYFLHLIPPIPFALKDRGIYHSIQKGGDGLYLATREQENWWNKFSPTEDIHILPGEPLYAYSAIFSPGNFNTTIYHEWQVYDESTKKWVTQTRLALAVWGGRDGGFRTFSMKNDITPGKWRVNVETKSGEVIGRLRFDVSTVPMEPQLEAITK